MKVMLWKTVEDQKNGGHVMESWEDQKNGGHVIENCGGSKEWRSCYGKLWRIKQ